MVVRSVTILALVGALGCAKDQPAEEVAAIPSPVEAEVRPAPDSSAAANVLPPDFDEGEPDVSEEPYEGPGSDTHQGYGLVPGEVALPLLSYGADSLEARRALPEPDSIRPVNAFMPQEADSARLVTWFYDDAWLLFTPDSGLVGVGIRAPTIGTGNGIRVGDTSAELARRGLATHVLADGHWDFMSADLDGRGMRIWIAEQRISRLYIGVLSPR